MTPLETLKAARDLISDPARWTQKTQARDRHGRNVDFLNDDAVCWCTLGAIAKADFDLWGKQSDADKVLRRLVPRGLVGQFNDTHTHAEVIALFDAAIAELEGAL